MGKTSSYWDQTRDLPDRNTLVSVVRIYGGLETAVMVAAARELPEQEFGDLASALAALAEAKAVSPEAAELIRRLKVIKDEAVSRDAMPLPTDVKRYERLVHTAIAELRRHRPAGG